MKVETERPEGSQIAVWVDQDIDTGHGLPVEICPDVFTLENGLTHTHVEGEVLPGFISGIVVVEPALESQVIEAAEEQPDENIFVEYVLTDDDGNITDLWDNKNKNWQPWTVPEPEES